MLFELNISRGAHVAGTTAGLPIVSFCFGRVRGTITRQVSAYYLDLATPRILRLSRNSVGDNSLVVSHVSVRELVPSR